VAKVRTAEKIVELKERAAELPHIKLISFQYGKTAALLAVSDELNFVETVNRHTNKKIEDDLCKVLIEKGMTPRILFLDETNWFNYITKGEELPQNGKNEQYRNHMKQVCMGLAVSEDNVPFMHEVCEGNRHDSKIFSELLDSLTERLTNLKITTEEMTLVFDKGNNSKVNIKDVTSRMHIVASGDLDRGCRGKEALCRFWKDYCFY